MHSALTKVCEILIEISGRMSALNASNQRATEAWAWHLPALSPAQMAATPYDIAHHLKIQNVEDLTEDQENLVQNVISSLDGVLTQIVPNMYSSPTNGIPAYVTTMNYVAAALTPLSAWVPAIPSALPGALVRKLSKVEQDLARMMPDKEDMELRIQLIREAYDAAHALPTTMQELKDTQSSVRQTSASASEYLGKISADHGRSEKFVETLKVAAAEASQYAKQAGDAYNITTSIGLAAAFDARARSLNATLYLWVGGLAVSLISLMVVGYYRLTAMKHTLDLMPFDASRVWIQVILSILSVGAPLWFAWISTKQISQRFRLAEDYAFKASVAKAYEGYRREAVRLDPQFEKALFASALLRLDEAPLRLLETTTHGSPIHELAESSVVKKLLEGVTDITSRIRKKPPEEKIATGN